MKKLLTLIIFLLIFNFFISLAKSIVVNTPYLNVSEIDPGESFEVKANVTEGNVINITETNITCYSSEGLEGENNWDSFTLLNYSLTWNVIDENTVEVSGVITLNTSSISGDWSCKVYAKNSSYESTYNYTSFKVNKKVGIVVFEESCEFEEGLPGDENKSLDCGEKNYITFMHDGNVNITVKIKGSNLIGKDYPNWIIDVGNITYANVTYGSQAPSPSDIKLTQEEAVLIYSWDRGSYPYKNTNNLYCWLDYPSPLKVQTYEGTIYLIAVEV
ncbi:MAG: hypothetical protein QW412_03305 [Candidatus Aenigmatarchaeota archaeon]